MKMKKTAVILGVGALFLGGLLAVTGTVSAYRGDPAAKGPGYSEERHEAMESIFESKDYDAWKEMMEGRGRILEVINEENFSKLIEAHELAGEGKMDEARQIREELGLKGGHRRAGNCQR
jgi:hypothetical protein